MQLYALPPLRPDSDPGTNHDPSATYGLKIHELDQLQKPYIITIMRYLH